MPLLPPWSHLPWFHASHKL
uniref:Uncharacterized protein n=1 Tax=Rhizophora mucronata TaxID=61149 RepID=A0A2P2NGE7_RHIMU